MNWKFLLFQKKKVQFFLNFFKICFTTHILTKNKPRLYPNISYMLPFSKGLYLLEALYSFIVYDSIKNKFISLTTKLNRREESILYSPLKLNEFSFIKRDSPFYLLYNINDLSNCIEIERKDFSSFNFLNHPNFFISKEDYKLIQYEKKNDQYVSISKIGEIKTNRTPYSLLLKNNLLFYYNHLSKNYILFDLNKEISYRINSKNKYAFCESIIENNGRLLKINSPVFKQLRQYTKTLKREPTYYIYALNKKKTEFFVTSRYHLIIFNKKKILSILPIKYLDVKGFKIGKFNYFFTIEKEEKDYNDFVYIFNSKTNTFKCIYNEKIEGNSFYYKNKLSYITISIIEIKVIDLETGKIVKLIKAENQGNLIHAIACPKDRILSVSQNNKLCLWDIKTGQLLFF